jgi:hypothetical protein
MVTAHRISRWWQGVRRWSRTVGLGGALFGLSACLAVAAVRLGVPGSPAVGLAVTLAITTCLVVHACLALGRAYAVALVVTLGAELLLVESAPGLAVEAFVIGIAAVAFSGQCDRRTCVLRAALRVAVVGACVGAVAVILNRPSDAGAELLAAAGGPMLGAAMSIIVGPLLERAFGHATRLTLNEWLSYEHPLLQRLMSAAPGTFQHSVNVGLFANAAAEAIGADGLLARVGGLYHDVGKMRAPEFFVENQTDANPHDGLAPSVSARMLRSHVTDGVDLVTAHHMGDRILDFVREHHGSGLMRLLQAKAEALGETTSAGTYSYPGPPPQSRETGLVMIADQVEATARAAPPVDDDACVDLVHRTAVRIQQEGQLSASGLESADLTTAEEAMARAVRAMYHRRLAYPATASSTTPEVEANS